MRERAVGARVCLGDVVRRKAKGELTPGLGARSAAVGIILIEVWFRCESLSKSKCDEGRRKRMETFSRKSARL
jgi:hypothetical protein